MRTGVRPCVGPSSAAVIDDSVSIVTAESPGIVRWWDGHTATERMVLGTDAGTVHDVVIMSAGPVGPVAISAGLQGARFWELTTGTAHELRQGDRGDCPHGCRRGAHARRPAGRVAAGRWRWRCRVLGDGPDHAVAASDRASKRSNLCARRLAPRSSLMVAAHAEGLLCLIDGVWGRVINEFRVGGDATSYSMSVLYGDQIPYIVLALDQHVHVIDVRTGVELYRWFVGSAELRRVVVLDSDWGPLIATLSEDGLVGVCTPKGDFVAAYELPAAASALAPVARNVLAAGYVGGWSMLKVV